MPVKQRHEKNEVSDNLVSYLYNLTNTLSMNITSSMGITEGFFFFFFLQPKTTTSWIKRGFFSAFLDSIENKCQCKKTDYCVIFRTTTHRPHLEGFNNYPATTLSNLSLYLLLIEVHFD